MNKTIFEITQMDCPSEENLIRMKLDGISTIQKLDFDIPNRKLTVFHSGETSAIEQSIDELKLGGKKLSTESAEANDLAEEKAQTKVLWAVLFINFAFFAIEMTSGLLSRSMGLVADSLDMMADSFVYAISLYAVGSTLLRKKRIARLAGYFQLTLAVLGFVEVVRRFIGPEQVPDYTTMIVVSAFALGANAVCLWLLQKSKSREAHMQASVIFTSNDVIINLGVIGSGFLVHWLRSGLPDLIIGTLVFIVVIRGALRILKLG